MKRPFRWLLLVTLVLGTAASPALAKQKAKISELTLMVDETGVGVSFFFENCFSRKIEKVIQNGVPVDLTFFIKLHRTRKVVKDKRLAYVKWDRRIHYDNLKEEYRIFLDEMSPPLVVKDFLEAKETVARVENAWISPLKPLDERATYSLRVRAALEPEGPPLRLADLLFFIPSVKVKTDWLVQRFRIGSFVMPKQTGSIR